jgi:hypothetical protein
MTVPFAVWYWPTKRVAYLGKNAMCSELIKRQQRSLPMFASVSVLYLTSAKLPSLPFPGCGSFAAVTKTRRPLYAVPGPYESGRSGRGAAAGCSSVELEEGRRLRGLSRPSGPADFWLWAAARPAGRHHVAHPVVQMRMTSRPIQHRAGNAEIIVLPRQAFIHDPALPHFRLERFQLGISAPRLRAIRKADSARLQIAVQGFQQADGGRALGARRR